MKKHIDEVNINSSQTTTNKQEELCTQSPDGEERAEKKAAEGHEVRRLELYDGEQLCATVYADFTTQEVTVENAEGLSGAAFGLEDQPSWAAFCAFAEKRCLPGVQPDLRGYLASIGMNDNSPLIVLQKDPERVNKDRQWIKLEVLKQSVITGLGQKG